VESLCVRPCWANRVPLQKDSRLNFGIIEIHRYYRCNMWPEITRVAIIPFSYGNWRIMGYMKDVFEGPKIARRIGESSKAVLEICTSFVRFHQFLPLMSRNFTGRRFPLQQVFSLLFLRMGSKIVAFSLLVLGQIILLLCVSCPLRATGSFKGQKPENINFDSHV